MKNDDMELSSGGTAVRRLSFRTWAVLAALGAFVVLMVANPGVAQAQINFNQLIISILLAILEAFRDSPFFALIAQILEAIIESLGGDISG